MIALEVRQDSEALGYSVILKIKAFIYRFFNIFGIHVYLASKEEKTYLETLEFSDDIYKHLYIGTWQAKNGFTLVWTYGMPIHKAFIIKIKHAFNFKDYND